MPERRGDRHPQAEELGHRSLVHWQQSEHAAPALCPAVIVLPSCTFMHGQGEPA